MITTMADIRWMDRIKIGGLGGLLQVWWWRKFTLKGQYIGGTWVMRRASPVKVHRDH